MRVRKRHGVKYRAVAFDSCDCGATWLQYPAQREESGSKPDPVTRPHSASRQRDLHDLHPTAGATYARQSIDASRGVCPVPGIAIDRRHDGAGGQANGPDRLGRRLHRRAGRPRDRDVQPELRAVPHAAPTQGTRPLSGEKFWEGYTQKTVGDLLTFVKTNMPNGQGGSLPAAQLQRSRRAHPEVERVPGREDGADARDGRQRPDHSQGRPGRTAGQYARPRRRLPGAEERERLGPDERDRASANREDRSRPGRRHPAAGRHGR